VPYLVELCSYSGMGLPQMPQVKKKCSLYDVMVVHNRCLISVNVSS